jgi:hypothetical protein
MNLRKLRILELLEFIEAPAFTGLLPDYLSDDDYGELQIHLAKNPEAGDIQGTGGFRKVRWADPRRGQGRRGGLSVIYYSFEQDMQIWLLTLYGKDEAADQTPKEKRLLKAAIGEETRQRTGRRTFRRK